MLEARLVQDGQGRSKTTMTEHPEADDLRTALDRLQRLLAELDDETRERIRLAILEVLTRLSLPTETPGDAGGSPASDA